MSKFIKLYNSKKISWKHVLFRYGEKRSWRRHQNWKCNITFSRHIKTYFHCNLITPFFRFTKCNGKIELGLGNHYFEFGF